MQLHDILLLRSHYFYSRVESNESVLYSFHVSRETYFYIENSCEYEIEKESPQT